MIGFKSVEDIPEDKYLKSLLGEFDEDDIGDDDLEDDEEYLCPGCGLPYSDCEC